MPPPLVHPEINRFARRIYEGEVVFFVGAGFSIDSEDLNAKRLVRRLIMRLYALEEAIAPHHGLVTDFIGTFGEDFDWQRNLKAPVKIVDFPDYVIGRLASRYYEINEWMVRAYGTALTALPANPAVGLSQKLAEAEAALVPQGEEKQVKPWRQSFRPLPDTFWTDAAEEISRDASASAKHGKLLFLDTVGFMDEQLMAGTFSAAARKDRDDPKLTWRELPEIHRSYRGRLRPRHHVLARLAREGLCPTLVTTNFDLLLEGALLLSGLCPPGKDPQLAPTSIPHFDVIASAESFYTKGKAYRTATLVKLHGCAHRIRELKRQIDETANAGVKSRLQHCLKHYLDEVVFTYREIQNWRDDSWAADFVRTLIRTRTLAFSGYSTADPVIHDTVRNVYEEMAREQSRIASFATSPRERDYHAPAYFLAFNYDDEAEGRNEFHGREILRAASAAVGSNRSIANGKASGEHPNYLRFRPSKPSAPRLGIDELLSWTHHLVFRRQQLHAMRTDLISLARSLFERAPAEEYERIHARFRRRLNGEMRAAHGRRTSISPQANHLRRVAIREALNWTSGFHRAMLREWACAQALQREASLSTEVLGLLNPLWYFPASERPSWVAWSAVLELALVRLAHFSQPGGKARPEPVKSSHLPVILATQALRPTVLIRKRRAPEAPLLALTIQTRGFSRIGTRPEVPGFPARYSIWNFPSDAVPWAPDSRSARRLSRFQSQNEHWAAPPQARLLWSLACGDSYDDCAKASHPDFVEQLLGSWTR